MKRRTLDIIFSVGGLLLAGLLLVMGLVLQSQAELRAGLRARSARRTEDHLHPGRSLHREEKKVDVPGEQCRQTHWSPASRPSATPTSTSASTSSEINDGKTYSETSTESRAAQRQADEAAKASPDAPATLGSSTRPRPLDGQTESLFRGETLRGLLLTSYGFSIFGERAEQAAWVCFGAALILALASIAGFVHAFTTSKEEVVG